jgi:hypothetical protein
LARIDWGLDAAQDVSHSLKSFIIGLHLQPQGRCISA